MEKDKKSSTILYRSLKKTLIASLVLYFILLGIITLKSPATQKEIQANFYGAKIVSDGKGPRPNPQKPYVCIAIDFDDTYAHECSMSEWIVRILERLIVCMYLTPILLFLLKLKHIIIIILTPLILFFSAYLFEKMKYRRKNI